MSDTRPVAALDRQFGIPGIARVVEGNGSLPKVVVTTLDAHGEIYLHGGHVTSWKPNGRDEVLFVSAHAVWQDGRAIRGGVPVCFPWFGNKADNDKAPAHGLVRTRAWQLDAIERNGESVTVTMSIASGPDTKAWWPSDYRLVHRVSFGPVLVMELAMTNTGAVPQSFEEALHAYFRVGDVKQVRLRGLDGVAYLDKTDQDRRETQRGDITIVSETDRVYLDTKGPVELEDPVLKRRIRVQKANSAETVVWNPWVDKAKALRDLGDDEWTKMVCIEGSNSGESAVILAPGAQHTMRVTVTVAS